MRVLLDCDGVVMDFNRGWKRIASRMLGVQVPYKQRTWQPFMEGVDLAPVLNEIMAQPQVWRESLPYPGVIDRLWQLESARFDFHIVTSIRPEFERTRYDWLVDWAVPFVDMVVTQGAADKVKQAKALDLRVAIDDNMDNCRALHEAGLHTFMLARWWNEPIEGIERVTWRQL